MPLHLVKLVVGVDTLGELLARGDELASRTGDWRVHTRATPRRAVEVLDGGSLYRVIKGVIVCRQRVLGVETHGEGRAAPCQIVLDPTCVRTVPTPRRPFQGWRYLAHEEVPADLETLAGVDDAPPELLRRLLELGVW